MRHLAELLPILLINETVTEHAVSFAEVKEHKVLFVNDVIIIAHQHTLDNLGHVTKVEGVVAFAGCWQVSCNCLVVNIDCRFDNNVGEDAGAKSSNFKLKVSLEDGGEDSLH